MEALQKLLKEKGYVLEWRKVIESCDHSDLLCIYHDEDGNYLSVAVNLDTLHWAWQHVEVPGRGVR